MLINTLFLPLCLASMMLIVGTSLEPRSFTPLLARPRAALVGLLSQLLLLPLLAWLLIGVFQLSGALAIGLLLVAAAPGGATSNLFSHLARGDVALSVALTACMSLLAPFWMPWAVQLQLGWLASPARFQLSWLQSVMQLLMVTALPLALGMLWRHLGRRWIQRNAQRLKTFASLILLLMIALLVWHNRPALQQGMHLQAALLVTLLAALALLAGWVLARACKLSPAEARTLSFETGVQNAGIAMLVAFTQLQLPEAGLVALLYGLLMNIPAFALLYALTRQPAAVRCTPSA